MTEERVPCSDGFVIETNIFLEEGKVDFVAGRQDDVIDRSFFRLSIKNDSIFGESLNVALNNDSSTEDSVRQSVVDHNVLTEDSVVMKSRTDQTLYGKINELNFPMGFFCSDLGQVYFI